MEAEAECKVPGVYSETGIPVEDPAPGLNSDVSKKDTPPAVAAPGPGLYFEIGKKARGVHALFVLFGSLFFSGWFLRGGFGGGGCWFAQILVEWFADFCCFSWCFCRSSVQGLPHGPEVYPDHLHQQWSCEHYRFPHAFYWFLSCGHLGSLAFDCLCVCGGLEWFE